MSSGILKACKKPSLTGAENMPSAHLMTMWKEVSVEARQCENKASNQLAEPGPRRH